jgi:hypothetical protein
MNTLQNEINRLKNLKNYKNLDTSALERLAQINLWKKQAKIVEKFAEKEDQTLAVELFDNYLANYEFTSYNDVTNVVDLVYEEVLKHSIQKEINKITSDPNTNFVPDKLIQSLHDVEARIWVLKEKAGIVGTKEKNDLTAVEELEKKFKTYIAFNKNEFTLWPPIICKDCGSKNVESVLLRRRVKDFEVLKHPFFSGRFYYNRRGMELVKAGIWSKEQYAFVFQTSVKYVDWCLENENKIVEIDDVEEKEILEFINSKEHLKEQTVPKNLKKN